MLYYLKLENVLILKSKINYYAQLLINNYKLDLSSNLFFINNKKFKFEKIFVKLMT